MLLVRALIVFQVSMAREISTADHWWVSPAGWTGRASWELEFRNPRSRRIASAIVYRISEREAETLRLDPGATRKDEGRLASLSPEHKVLLTAQVERVRALMQRMPVGIVGGIATTSPKPWNRPAARLVPPACCAIDCHRKAVRNMVNSICRSGWL